MKAHGYIEKVGGIITIVTGVIMFFASMGISIWIALAYLGGSVVGGVISIILGNTLLEDSARLESLENELTQLKGTQLENSTVRTSRSSSTNNATYKRAQPKPGMWICKSCSKENYGNFDYCEHCGFQKF